MYIGSTDVHGLHHLVYELVDNSIDEALAGYCDVVDVHIMEGNILSVTDNGRGIPVEKHPDEKDSVLEIVMTRLHAGGKFDKKSYNISAGLHGVGVSVVNALSKWCVAEVYRDGFCWKQRYEKGKAVTAVEKKEATPKRGTKVTFCPDGDIFSDTVFHFDILAQRFRELAFLNQGITINIIDERAGGRKEVYHFEGGIREFVLYLNKKKTLLHEPLYFCDSVDDHEVEVCMVYNHGITEHLYGYANTIYTREGGTHVTGFRSALTRIISDLLKHASSNRKQIDIEGEDVREGLSVVISVKIPDPQFEGQTKTKLGNTAVRSIVETLVRKHIGTYLDSKPKISALILKKVLSAAEARVAALKAKEVARRKSVLNNSGLPGLLVDCSETDPEQSEIYIVEGDSAGGSAKQGRDRRFQAVLPLRGKMLNVEKNRIDKVLTNDKLQPIIATLGAGIDDSFNIDKLRYHKVIIMADADVDGSHIRTLLLTFFFRYMREMIEREYVYIALPPLYKLAYKKEIHYAYNEKDRDDIIKMLIQKYSITNQSILMQRYKGLGEMNPDQLWETTMNPEVRNIIRITIEDAVKADQLFSMLMGEEVRPRREFIQENALAVKNLDV
ncbi:hypothetical protein LSH36_583g02006 [Paralvinella palmiformis]|uniref:DNA gyrase subunit B n=1 Tax=Paralvinella palmiformis TaxID=53620 RepID=A0AAD9J684_9ANNE|nr:hypothetical protein LSH36_583g02006 [Paralvinella palmiformis]